MLWADPFSRGVLPSMFVLLSVIKCKNNPICIYCIVDRGQRKKEREWVRD